MKVVNEKAIEEVLALAQGGEVDDIPREAAVALALHLGGVRNDAFGWLYRRAINDGYANRLAFLPVAIGRIKAEVPQAFSDYKEPSTTDEIMGQVGEWFAARQKAPRA